jgi:hypothetical protein
MIRFLICVVALLHAVLFGWIALDGSVQTNTVLEKREKEGWSGRTHYELVLQDDRGEIRTLPVPEITWWNVRPGDAYRWRRWGMWPSFAGTIAVLLIALAFCVFFDGFVECLNRSRYLRDNGIEE